eukprot:Skav215651  [mRNA]  locus=scaffold1588:107069:118209:+ [translate_table: standard]
MFRHAQDSISFNAAISACEKAGECPWLHRKKAAGQIVQVERWQVALWLFAAMERPDAISYSAAISALEKGHLEATSEGPRNEWALALSFFAAMGRAELRPDVICCNAAISACEKQGHWEEAGKESWERWNWVELMELKLVALSLFASLERYDLSPTVVTWNAVLGSCAKAAVWRTALRMFQAMDAATVEADATWLAKLSRGGSDFGLLDPELWKFLRLLATLKAKVPDLAQWLQSKEAADVVERREMCWVVVVVVVVVAVAVVAVVVVNYGE